MIRSKRPVGAISAKWGDLGLFVISTVMGRVYPLPPNMLDCPSNPTILMGIFRTWYGMSSCCTNDSLNWKQLAPESSKSWMRVRLPSTSNWVSPSGYE